MAVVKERVRLSFGLLGPYDHVTAGVVGKPDKDQNQPSAILSRMFEVGQPDLVFDVPSGGAHDQKRVPADSPLTVKSLVNWTYDLFDGDGGIVQDPSLNKMCSVDFFLRNEVLASCEEDFKGGVFLKPYTESTALKDRFKPTVAFLMLEKMGYVKIDKNVRGCVYQCDEDTNLPGTISINGRNYTLEDPIEECPAW